MQCTFEMDVEIVALWMLLKRYFSCDPLYKHYNNRNGKTTNSCVCFHAIFILYALRFVSYGQFPFVLCLSFAIITISAIVSSLDFDVPIEYKYGTVIEHLSVPSILKDTLTLHFIRIVFEFDTNRKCDNIDLSRCRELNDFHQKSIFISCLGALEMCWENYVSFFFRYKQECPL